jgi:hypothetical protein
MRLIIAGSRDIVDYHVMRECWQQYTYRDSVTEIISGDARGVDKLAIRLANDLDIPVTIMAANWAMHGRRAGYKRNAEMADYGHSVLAIWDHQSPGTKHMIDIADNQGLYVEIYNAYSVCTSRSSAAAIATLLEMIP